MAAFRKKVRFHRHLARLQGGAQAQRILHRDDKVILGMALCLLVLALSLTHMQQHAPAFRVGQRVAALDPDNELRIRAIAKNPMKDSKVSEDRYEGARECDSQGV